MPHITHRIESRDIWCSSSTTTSTGSTPCKSMPPNISVHACVLCLQHAWRPSTACFASFTSNTWDTLWRIDKTTQTDSNTCDTVKGNWHISKQTRCKRTWRLSMFTGINMSWCYTTIVIWHATREGKNKACRYKSFYLSHFQRAREWAHVPQDWERDDLHEWTWEHAEYAWEKEREPAFARAFASKRTRDFDACAVVRCMRAATGGRTGQTCAISLSGRERRKRQRLQTVDWEKRDALVQKSPVTSEIRHVTCEWVMSHVNESYRIERYGGAWFRQASRSARKWGSLVWR